MKAAGSLALLVFAAQGCLGAPKPDPLDTLNMNLFLGEGGTKSSGQHKGSLRSSNDNGAPGDYYGHWGRYRAGEAKEAENIGDLGASGDNGAPGDYYGHWGRYRAGEETKVEKIGDNGASGDYGDYGWGYGYYRAGEAGCTGTMTCSGISCGGGPIPPGPVTAAPVIVEPVTVDTLMVEPPVDPVPIGPPVDKAVAAARKKLQAKSKGRKLSRQEILAEDKKTLGCIHQVCCGRRKG